MKIPRPDLTGFDLDDLKRVDLTFWVSERDFIRFDLSIDDVDESAIGNRGDEVELCNMIRALYAHAMRTYGPDGAKFDPSSFVHIRKNPAAEQAVG